MLRNTIMIIAFLTIGTLHSFAQNDYYWSSGKQIFMDKISTKKFVVVDSSITSISEFERVLDDTSLMVSGFFEKNIIPQINLRDSAYLDKNFATIESKDSINSDILLTNNYIDYVSDYYQINNNDIGTSNLFYVKLSEMQDTLVLDSISGVKNINVLGNFSNSPSWFILECTEQSAGNTLDMANLYYESGLFIYSHPNLLNNFHPTCTNDTYFKNQWGLNNTNDHDNIDINACEAWNITKGNSNIVIAVLDSGIKLDHPDLTNVDVSLSYDLMAGSSPSSLYYDQSWKDFNHGTNCAGIIGAQHNDIGVSGIAPNCILMSLSLNWNLYGINLDQALNEGLNHAWQNGADIISNSWGIVSEVDLIKDAIDSAVNNGRNGLGCVVAQSAGNAGFYEPSYPSIHPDVISVGAIDSCGIRVTKGKANTPELDSMCGTVWGYNVGSNYGEGLSVVAPGSDVPTTNVVDDNWSSDEYVNDFGGTSAAAPHVSGVAALLLSVRPDLTYTEVKDAIESTAQKIRTDFYDYNESKPNGMWNEKLGYGMVDAYAALNEVLNCHAHTFIESNENITWTTAKNLCDTLIIEGTLTVQAPLHFYPDAPHIIIQNGGHLVFDTGSELYHWEDENYAGNINVEAGSTLEFKNGSDIVLAENGKIMVNHDANNTGEIIFNDGASLTLLDDNTNLEIAGDLHIASNATFTFSGDGYIKFSKPGGDDASNNIFCSTNSSFVLQGSGQNDKIMEVQQSTVKLIGVPQ